MSIDHEIRPGWRANWLRSIQEFADDEKQRRLWLDPNNTNPHFSFVEYICCYFDGLFLPESGYDEAVKESLVSREEVEAVAHFHQLVDKYCSPTDDYDHEAILADPKWAEVVEAAKQAQAALKWLIQDPRERQLLGGR